MYLFEDLGLNLSLARAVAELGFEKPTPVQEKVIPRLLKEDSDMVALSQTGTGKTAAFGLPLLSLLDFAAVHPQALILCPTRELCMQIARDLNSYSKYLDRVSVTAVYGGASIVSQIKDLKKGSQIIVATPGRMVDLINRKRVHLEKIRYVVLDEADEMLNMGFKEDLDIILSQTPDEKNTWLFSATMPDEVLRISRQYMHQPVEMTMGTKNQGNENIEHIYYSVRHSDRYAALKRLADYHPDMFGIVFCRTRRETQEIADRLIKDGYSADALHGDLSQSQRDQVMKRYRNRMVRLLIATDVAARGIDVDDITHVINYNLPDELENYTHRSGRTARAGKTGISVVLASPSDLGRIRAVEKKIRKKFVKGRLPTSGQVREKQLFGVAKKIQETLVEEERFSKVLPQIHDQLEYLSKEELINRILTMECDRLPEVKEETIEEMSAKNIKDSDRRSGDRIKLFVNLGKYDGLNKFDLLAFLSRHSGVAKREISIAEVNNSFSLIRVKASIANDMISGLKNKTLGNRPVRIEYRTGKNERKGKKKEKNLKNSKKHYFEPEFDRKKKKTIYKKPNFNL